MPADYMETTFESKTICWDISDQGIEFGGIAGNATDIFKRAGMEFNRHEGFIRNIVPWRGKTKFRGGLEIETPRGHMGQIYP